jgi:alpha-tubulin suppressor-like RCC1 family protein
VECVGEPATDNGQPFCSCVCSMPRADGGVGGATGTDGAHGPPPVGQIMVPVDDGGAVASAAIASGLFFTCVTVAGAVQCWGYNAYGMLGDGSYADSTTPVQVLGVSGPLGLSTGGYNGCALPATRTVQCWGDNFGGQLGQLPLSDADAPVVVPGVANAVQVSMGDDLGCALGSTGTVTCWGANNRGQAGTGQLFGSPYFMVPPGPVVGLTTAVSVSAGYGGACALLVDGTVRCWGANDSGQLGTAAAGMMQSPVPVTIAGIAGATAVSSGWSPCALLGDGTVACWGSNSHGELGAGSSAQSSAVPLKVAGITNATAISVGVEYACARLADATATCWGSNMEGTLGDGTNNDSPVPVPVMGLTGVAAVVAGNEHTCAQLDTGGFTCWGNNQYGQLGDGTTMDSTVPVSVNPP